MQLNKYCIAFSMTSITHKNLINLPHPGGLDGCPAKLGPGASGGLCGVAIGVTRVPLIMYCGDPGGA